MTERLVDTRISGTTLVGRDQELPALAAHLELSRIDGGTVVLRGGAGIGKTALLDVLVGLAQSEGFVTLTGSSSCSGGDAPYAPFEEALLRARGTGDLADHVVELAELHRSGRATADRHQIFVRWQALLTERSRGRPILLAFDDFHSADDDSIVLTEHLARTLRGAPIVFAIAVRHPLPVPNSFLEHQLARVESAARTLTLDLQPLSTGEISRLVANRLGATADESLVSRLGSLTGGNPFLLSEVLRAWPSDDPLPDGFTFYLPASPVVLGRILPLSPQVRRLGSAIAATDSFRLSLLPLAAAIAGLDEAHADDAFDQLCRAGLLEPVTDDLYSFHHQLVREALIDDAGPVRMREIHRGWADALVRRRSGGHDMTPAEIAHHACRGAIGTSEEAAALAQEAGDAVLGFAPATAATWYQRAASLTPADSVQTARRQARQAWALVRDGRMAEASTVGRCALERLLPGHERELTAELLVHDLLGRGDGLAALSLVESETALGSTSPRLAALEASARLLLDDLEGAAVAIERVRSVVRCPSPDDNLILAAELNLTFLKGDSAALAALLRRAASAGQAGTPAARQFILLTAAYQAVSARLIQEATALVDAAEHVSSDDFAGGGATIAGVRALLAWHAGDWPGAMAAFPAARAELEHRGHWQQASRITIAEAAGHLATGNYAAVAKVSPQHPLAVHHAAAWADVRSRLALANGNRDAAEQIASTALEACGPPTPHKVALQCLLAEVAAAHGSDRTAGRFIELARETARTFTLPTVQLTISLTAANVLRDLEAGWRALGIAEELGLPFETVRAKLAIGRLESDPVALLHAAWHEARRLGARPLEVDVAGELRRRRLPVPRPPRRTDSLTEAEWSVARLVRDGLRNREIAEALHYSPRTIEKHISRIFMKLGVDSRLALARLVDQRDEG